MGKGSLTRVFKKSALTETTPYSPVYSLMLGTKTMIVLSSDDAVKDLLDRRSGNYSDRPEMYVGQTVASGGLRLVVMVCAHLMSTTSSRELSPCQDLENRLGPRDCMRIICSRYDQHGREEPFC